MGQVAMNKNRRTSFAGSILYGAAITVSFMVFASFFSPARAMPMQTLVDSSEKIHSALLGEWKTPDMDAVISIRQCGDVLYARLVQHDYENLTSTDINNPNPTLRTRQLLGVRILDGLHLVKTGVWRGGELYDPRTGKTYFSKLKFLDEDRVKITGCVAPGLCKGYVWTRNE